jgi:hypothetical protein
MICSERLGYGNSEPMEKERRKEQTEKKVEYYREI